MTTLILTKIDEGIFCIKMPLPFRLDHINLYLLEDEDGWLLIDTGLNTDFTKSLWIEFLSSDFFKKPIKKIILTHLHPDHIGMSSWLSETLHVNVMLSAADLAMARFLWNNHTEMAKQIYTKHWFKLGLTGNTLNEMVDLRNHYRKLVKCMPENLEVIHANTLLSTVSGEWQFLSGAGHSPEHMALWNQSKGYLISGDHVLPTITPNISLHPFGLKNPLGDYLSSLNEFKKLNCCRYFPAHGPFSNDLHNRIDQIIDHHNKKIMDLMTGIGSSHVTVADAMPLLFTRELPSHQLMFAYGEAAAHLIYLANQQAISLREEDGVWRFNVNRSCVKTPTFNNSIKVAID